MKHFCRLYLLAVLSASVSMLFAQSGSSLLAQPSPSVQSTPAKSLSGREKEEAFAELDGLHKTYSSKGNIYLTVYYIFALGAAVASAAAGLLLQWETYKRLAQGLAFAGSVLVVTTTYVDFRANSVANKLAANQIVHLKIQVMKDEIPDRATLIEREQAIYEAKQSTEKVTEPPKK
jgi:hypothetical protein